MPALTFAVNEGSLHRGDAETAEKALGVCSTESPGSARLFSAPSASTKSSSRAWLRERSAVSTLQPHAFSWLRVSRRDMADCGDPLQFFIPLTFGPARG